MKPRFARVIPLLRLRRDLQAFTYRLPSSSAAVVRGNLVWVPFRSHTIAGVVEQTFSNPEPTTRQLKSIETLVSQLPLSELFFRTAEHLQKNFAISAGLAFKTMLPQPLKHPRPSPPHLPLPPFVSRIKRARLDSLKTAQLQIQHCILENKSSLLLFTDEGEKWAIASALIRHALSRQVQTLIIVPDEFTLEAWRGFLQYHFPTACLGVSSSHTAQSQKFLTFEAFRSGQTPIMLGTKSSVFTLGPKLRWIILDDEESESHKQYDQNPRYDARELLRFYEQLGIPSVILSAAPTTESYAAAVQHHRFIELGTPIDPPKIQTIDREEEMRKSAGCLLPDRMIDEIRAALTRKQHAFLFFNRKGFAKLLFCRDCQTLQRCPKCAWPLHMLKPTRPVCPVCLQNIMTTGCAKCGSIRLRPARFGLNALTSEIAQHFPEHLIQQLDSDHPEPIKNASITCGSQFAFPRLQWDRIGYVGWMTPELTLPASGFRSAEHLFQTLKFFQRKLLNTFGAQVNILTHVPQHPCFRFANNNQIAHFYEHELPDRANYGYPPLRRLLKLIFFDKDVKVNQSLALKTREKLLALADPHLREVSDPLFSASGPTRTKDRCALLLKLDPEYELDLSKILPEQALIDLDPLTF